MDKNSGKRAKKAKTDSDVVGSESILKETIMHDENGTMIGHKMQLKNETGSLGLMLDLNGKLSMCRSNGDIINLMTMIKR